MFYYIYIYINGNRCKPYRKYSSTILNTFEIKYSNAYYEYIIFLFMRKVCYTIPLYYE